MAANGPQILLPRDMAFREPFRTPVGAFQRSPLKARSRDFVQPFVPQFLPGAARVSVLFTTRIDPDSMGDLPDCDVTPTGFPSPRTLPYLYPASFGGADGTGFLYRVGNNDPDQAFEEYFDFTSVYVDLTPAPTGGPLALNASCISYVNEYAFDGTATASPGVRLWNNAAAYDLGIDTLLQFGTPELSDAIYYLAQSLPTRPEQGVNQNITLPQSAFTFRSTIGEAQFVAPGGYPYMRSASSSLVVELSSGAPPYHFRFLWNENTPPPVGPLVMQYQLRNYLYGWVTQDTTWTVING